MPRVARAYCPDCAREIRPETPRSIAEQVLESLGGQSGAGDFQRPRAGENKARGVFRFSMPTGLPPRLDRWRSASHRRAATVQRLPAIVRVIQDRVTVSAESESRLLEAIEAALRLGRGQIEVIPQGDGAKNFEPHPFSTGWHCAHCDIEIAPPSPGLFSFNNPLGACPKCRGFGRSIGIDLDLAIPDRSLSIGTAR